MADQDVQAIIRKAISDDTFRLALSRNFDQAIAGRGLELTAAEQAALKKVNWSNPLPTTGSAAMADWVHIYNTN